MENTPKLLSICSPVVVTWRKQNFVPRIFVVPCHFAGRVQPYASCWTRMFMEYNIGVMHVMLWWRCTQQAEGSGGGKMTSKHNYTKREEEAAVHF
jgi:hypothetical protein